MLQTCLKRLKKEAQNLDKEIQNDDFIKLQISPGINISGIYNAYHNFRLLIRVHQYYELVFDNSIIF